MRKAFISPLKYVQGEGELSNLGFFVKGFGSRALLIASRSGYERVKDTVDKTAEKFGVIFEVAEFGGECSYGEIDRLSELARKTGSGCIVGLGGGKAIDTAKCVADGKPVIIVPTIAATDAPTSHLAVVYSDEGVVVECRYLTKNPDVVLVDTEIIAQAPVRLLVSGMGDALATYFEARSHEKSFGDVVAGFPCGVKENVCPPVKQTRTSSAIAKLCYETLLSDGLRAKQDCELKVVTPALENIIEANILLSGLGFENGGLSAAHSIHDGLTVVPEVHGSYHGEKVAFSTVCQLILENAPREEIETVVKFCLEVGLPVCLEDLGIKSLSAEKLAEVAAVACSPVSNMKFMPFKVTPDMVAAAVLAADKAGKDYKTLLCSN